MFKFIIVARHTAHQTLRQPLFYILTGVFAAMIWTSQFFTMFTLDEQLEGVLLREMGISTIALCCAAQAVLMSWLVVTRDMERLTALTVLSKPVTRTQFLLGKYLGILSTLLFAAVILGSTLVATLWQKEGGPRFRELSAIGEIGFSDFSGGHTGPVEAVEPLPPARPVRARVTIGRALHGENSSLARRAGLPEGGRFAQGTLNCYIDNQSLDWRIEKSELIGGKTVLTVLVPWEWRDEEGRPSSSPVPGAWKLPVVGADGRVTPSRMGSAQRHWARFWEFEAVQVAKASLLAVIRVAVVLAFAVSLAPHASLVLNGSVAFLVFLIGHIANTISLALTDPSRGAVSRAAGRIFHLIVPNLESSRVESLVAAGREISGGYVLWSAAYGLAYAALVLVVGAAVFSRKEIRS